VLPELNSNEEVRHDDAGVNVVKVGIGVVVAMAVTLDGFNACDAF
jgi:hypothetical protein